MRLVLLSDTHCQLSKIEVPEGDLLIHAGDATYRGTVQEISKFNEDLGKIKDKFKHGILFTPGNHDWGYEKDSNLFKSITTNAKVLIHESIEIEGIRFFLSPYQPAFCNWAYNVPRGEALAEKWSQIPDNTNVLVTHGPPMGILDPVERFNGQKCEWETEHVGCEDLYNKIQQLGQLKLHVFGHIHLGYGMLKVGRLTYANASVCTEEYKPINKPIVVEL